MSTSPSPLGRRLDGLLQPRSIAVVGASTTPNKLGYIAIRNLLLNNYSGPVFPINPRHAAVSGLLCYPNVQALPMVPDLAIICTPAPSVPALVRALADFGCKNVVITSGGMGESMCDGSVGAPGAAAEATKAEQHGPGSLLQQVLAVAQPARMRILGPDSIGLIVPRLGLNASVAHLHPQAGTTAVVFQSSALCAGILDWAHAHGIGFSIMLSLGRAAGVDAAQIIDFLDRDPHTQAILLHIDSVTRARAFLSAARGAARAKPLIIMRSSGTPYGSVLRPGAPGAQGVGRSDLVWDAAVRRAGCLRVSRIAELFDALQTLTCFRGSTQLGERVAILSNGVGPAVIAADELYRQSGTLATLQPPTLAALSALSPLEYLGNPVALRDDASTPSYARALKLLLSDAGVDVVIALLMPSAMAAGPATAAAVLEAIKECKSKKVLTVWLGGENAAAARRVFTPHAIAIYESPESAVQAYCHLLEFQRNQHQLMETPTSVSDVIPADGPERARAMVEHVLSRDGALKPEEAVSLLACFGLPVCDRLADAASPDSMSLRGSVDRSVTVRVACDPLFGTCIIVGQEQHTFSSHLVAALPPLNSTLARDALSRVYVSRLFDQDVLQQINTILVQVSQMVVAVPDVTEALLVLSISAEGTVCVACCSLTLEQAPAGLSRLAICPYPREEEEVIEVKGGLRLFVRPIRPEDEAMHIRYFKALSAEDVYFRFASYIKEATHAQIARLTQLDYNKEMAFVAVLDTHRTEEVGVVRVLIDCDTNCAEFAVSVRSDMKHHGIGKALMRKVIAYCRSRQVSSVVGFILADNAAMLALARSLGFVLHREVEDDMVRVVLPLGIERSTSQPMFYC